MELRMCASTRLKTPASKETFAPLIGWLERPHAEEPALTVERGMRRYAAAFRME